MTPEERFRRLRDADNWHPLEPRGAADAVARGDRRVRAPHGRRRTALVTAVVLVGVLAATAVVIRSSPLGSAAPAGASSTGPTAAASPSPSRSAAPAPGTVAALPPVSGRLLATWTSDDATLPVGPFSPDGDAIVMTSACTGGGSVSIAVSHHGDSSTGCTGISTDGPSFTLQDGHGIPETRPVTVRIRTTGHPRFAVRLWAVPAASHHEQRSAAGRIAATGPDVPAALRSCTAADFAPEAAFSRISRFEGGVVTVRSVATSDCAIRRYPSMTYRAASDGRQVGDAASPGGGPTEVVGDAGTGDAPAPAVRLVAGGQVYFVATLFLAARFAHEHGRAACRPVAIGALRVVLAPGSIVRVPIPSTPSSADCANTQVEANGVSPAVERLVDG